MCASHTFEREDDRGSLCRACGVCGALPCAIKKVRLPSEFGESYRF